MASVVVDGLVIPVSLAGHPVLDFCNTRAGWGEPAPKEYLRSQAHLSVWARENGLAASAPAQGADADAVVARAVAFRDGLYAVLTGTAGPDDWAAVNAEVRRTGATAALRPFGGPDLRAGSGGAARSGVLAPSGGSGVPAPSGGSGGPASSGGSGPRAAWDLAGTGGPDLSLRAVVWAAAGFLTGPLATAVAACPGTGCGWLFADPRRRRRWCSMAMCGNRAKARRHASRQKAR